MKNIGYKNSYGHEVVSIQRYDEKTKKFVTIQSFFEQKNEFSEIPLKTKVINRVIDFLENLKK